MQLIVLGMHRSGTSVLARLLNMMGAYFGAEGISTGRNAENPKGFWERRDVRRLNDFVLHSAGADWHKVSKFDYRYLPQGVLEEFDRHAAQLVLELDAHRPWVVKEPRLCLLLPLWKKWLELPVAISIYRNPVEVASSLHKRNGIPLVAGLGLWHQYIMRSYSVSQDIPNLRVSYKRLMDDASSEVAILYQQLVDAGVQGLRLPSDAEISRFIDGNLYRERAVRADLLQFNSAPQVEIFNALEAGDQPVWCDCSEQMRALAEYEEGVQVAPANIELFKFEAKGYVSEDDKVLNRSLYEVGVLRESLGRMDGDLRVSEQRLLAAQSEIALERAARIRVEALHEAAVKSLDEFRVVCEELRARKASLEVDVSSAQEELEGLSLTLEAERKQKYIWSAEREDLMSRLDDSVTKLEKERELKAAVEDAYISLERKVEQVRVQLEDRSAENDRLGSELAEQSEQLVSLGQQLVAVKEEARGKEQSLDQSSQAIAGVSEQLHEALQYIAKLERSAARTTEAARKFDRAECERDELHIQVQKVSESLRLTTSLHAAAEDRLIDRYREISRMTMALLSKDREAEHLRQQLGQAELRLADAHWRIEAHAKFINRLKLNNISEAKRTGQRFLRAIGMPVRWVRKALRRDWARTSYADQLQLLRDSSLFDAEWYLKVYPDVSEKGLDPTEHYLQYGAFEGRNPSVGFNTKSYLSLNPDVWNSEINPLVHFIKFGHEEGRKR